MTNFRPTIWTRDNTFHLYVIDSQTGQKVNIEHHKITIDKAQAHQLNANGWLFDWQQTAHLTVEALTLASSKQIQGLVAYNNEPGFIKMDLIESAPYNRGKQGRYQEVGRALFALTAKISLDQGNNGFVTLVPKTRLREYYSNHMHAINLGNGNQYIDDKDASWLINGYVKGVFEDE